MYRVERLSATQGRRGDKSMNNMLMRNGLAAEELAIVQMEVDRKKKSTGVLWVLWLFLCGVGGHQFYLGNTGKAIGYLVLNFAGWLTFWFGLGFLFWGAIGVWAIVDAFLMGSELNRYNDQIEANAIQQVKAMRQQVQ